MKLFRAAAFTSALTRMQKVKSHKLVHSLGAHTTKGTDSGMVTNSGHIPAKLASGWSQLSTSHRLPAVTAPTTAR